MPLHSSFTWNHYVHFALTQFFIKLENTRNQHRSIKKIDIIMGLFLQTIYWITIATLQYARLWYTVYHDGDLKWPYRPMCGHWSYKQSPHNGSAKTSKMMRPTKKLETPLTRKRDGWCSVSKTQHKATAEEVEDKSKQRKRETEWRKPE